jgi:hypothetical protein
VDDLMKEYGAGPEAASEPVGWPVPESVPSDIDPWIAYMRGEEPPFRRTAAHAKKPRAFVGFRKKTPPRQFSSS